MKKMLLSAVALLSIAPLMGQQEQKVDSASSSVFQELRSLPAKTVSFAKRVFDFEKAVDYLKGARNCLSGIGCTKRQSYLANYLLGATYGFAQSQAFNALMYQSPTRWANQVDEQTGQIRPGLGAKLARLQLLVNELGYRYLVKEKVHLFRCLTFRGCTDQTKRYAFYNLGIWSGRRATGLQMAIQSIRYQVAAERQRPQRQREEALRQTHVEITDSNVKTELKLDQGSDFFEWYEVLGFQATPSERRKKKSHKRLSRQYHPDKAKSGQEQLHAKIQQALNDAMGKSSVGFEVSELPLALPAPQ